MAQISLTFPDGNARQYDAGVTRQMWPPTFQHRWPKRRSAHGQRRALRSAWPIDADADIAIHTMKDDAQALELIRHDLAHIMARAVQEIWPDVKVTIGPVIENGWYYDFDRAEPFTPEDLARSKRR